jgi:CheY-like chemotaxis protein
VEDTGIGFDPRQQQSLFDAFSQADASISRKYGGTGLGLTICKRLVDLMGGRIEVFSELGRGSRFVVTLDLALPPAGESTTTVLDQLGLLAGLKCLVADDVTASRESLGSFLTAMGLRVTAVNAATTAIALLRQCPMDDPYELVILDWQMPGLDGIEASYQIKDSTGLTLLPKVLLTTAYPRPAIDPLVNKDYIDGILIKPFSLDRLATAIADLFPPERRSTPQDCSSLTAPPRLQDIAGARILLVEDDEINQQVAAELLRSLDLIVEIAPHGQAALEKIAVHPYDLIVMDIQMPGMDGYEVTRRIRGLFEKPGADQERLMTVPIVAMTAHGMPADRRKSLQAGMNDHLFKPIDPQALFLTLLKWIPPRSSLPATPSPSADQGRNLNGSWGALPRIPGLNVKGGITRLAGNQAAYFRLLQRFYQTYQTFPDRLQGLFDAQQFGEILNLIHSLQGVSGNLGAEDLYRALSDFNHHLKQSEGLSPHLGPYFERVQQTLTTLLQALADAPLGTMTGPGMTNSPKTSSPPEKVPLQLLVKNFSELLERDIGAAIAVFEQLKRAAHRGEWQSMLSAMETELENFNLDNLRQQLQTLTAYLESPHDHGQSASGGKAQDLNCR